MFLWIMSSTTEQIAYQNNEYHESLIHDIQVRNKRVIDLMNATVEQQEIEIASERLNAMNSFSPTQRRRLMGGEKLDDILGDQFKKSKYYNTSDDGANAIPKNILFEYQIGDHLMAYEVDEIKINHDLKTIDLPVVAYCPEKQDYCDMIYTIYNDDDMFDIVQHQREAEPINHSFESFDYESNLSRSSSTSTSPNGHFPYDIEIDDIPEWVQEDYDDQPFVYSFNNM
jgi:hypothetical protein